MSRLDCQLAHSQEGGAHEGRDEGGGAENELALSEDSALPTRSHPRPAPRAAHQHLEGARTVTGGVAWPQRKVLPLRTGLGVGQAEKRHQGTLCGRPPAGDSTDPLRRSGPFACQGQPQTPVGVQTRVCVCVCVHEPREC